MENNFVKAIQKIKMAGRVVSKQFNLSHAFDIISTEKKKR